MKQAERGHNHFQMAHGNINFGARISPLFLLILVQLFVHAEIKKEGDMTMEKVQNDKEAIRSLLKNFLIAFNAGNIDGIMKNYIPDKSLVVFDVVPRKEYFGADAYRKDWEDMFSHFEGTPKMTMTDLGITSDGDLGFSHCLAHITGTNKQGHPVDYTVRVTDGFRKLSGRWLIALEHISVPVDLATGKAVIAPKL